MDGVPSHARAALLAGLSLLASGCRSATAHELPSAAASGQAPDSPWSPLAAGLPGTWRDLRLYGGECAFVLASGDAAAQQAHDVARIASQVFVDALGRSPRRGLLIAGSKEDRLLVEDAEALLEALPRWNAAATGREAPPSGSGSRRGGRRGDVPPELAARLLTGGIPVDEPALDLPAVLRERIAYVVLLPSDDCLDATCAAMTELALEREGVSWIQRKLAEAVVGDPAQRMADEFRAVSLATLLDVVSWSEGLEAQSADAVLARAVASGALPERARRRAAERAYAPGMGRP